MFRASSAHLQEDTVVHMQHMVLSLSMTVPGGLLVHSLSSHSSCVQYEILKKNNMKLTPFFHSKMFLYVLAGKTRQKNTSFFFRAYFSFLQRGIGIY